MDEALYEEMFRVESRHWWFQAKHKIVRSLLDRYLGEQTDSGQPKLRLADLGCGCGMMISTLSDRYEAIGLDASEQAARLAAERGICIEVGQLPGPTKLPGSHFDAVLLLDVLEHLDDDSGTITEATRLLKSGGLMIATVPAHQWLWTRRDELHHHRRRYSFGQFAKLMERPELQALSITSINSILFPMALAERFYRKFRPIADSGDLRLPTRVVNAILRESFSFERHLIGRIRLPIGLSLLAVLRKQPRTEVNAGS